MKLGWGWLILHTILPVQRLVSPCLPQHSWPLLHNVSTIPTSQDPSGLRHSCCSNSQCREEGEREEATAPGLSGLVSISQLSIV